MGVKKMTKDLNNEYIKYGDCCEWICYYYFKSRNEIISISEVANAMGGNIIENKKIIKRILKGLGKNVLFADKAPLTYSDCMQLHDFVKNEKTYKFQIIPFTISIVSLLIVTLSSIVNTDYCDNSICQYIFPFTVFIIFIFCILYISKFFKNN